MYHEDKEMTQVIPYLKLATTFSKKFRDDKISMDRQVYLKEAYVKVMQVIKHCLHTANGIHSSKDNRAIYKLIDCVQGVACELPALNNDQDFIIIRTVAFSIFVNNSNKENNTENSKKNSDTNSKDNEATEAEYLKYIEQTNENVSPVIREMYNTLVRESNESVLVSNMKKIKFENPALRRLGLDIKNNIDEGEKSRIVSRGSPGKKVKW